MKEIFLVLIGGICSALGGCIAIWYQAKKARKIRMEELRGEQQLEACKNALSLTDRIYTLWVQGTADDVLKLLLDNGEWFSMNQVLLPHTFVENWRSIRLNLNSMKRKEEVIYKIPDGQKRDERIDEFANHEDFVDMLVKEMDEVLRSELGLKEVKIKRPE
jgi:hypothetical protein